MTYNRRMLLLMSYYFTRIILRCVQEQQRKLPRNTLIRDIIWFLTQSYILGHLIVKRNRIAKNHQKTLDLHKIDTPF